MIKLTGSRSMNLDSKGVPIADELKMNGNVLTQNGESYDLDNLPEYISPSEEDENPIQEKWYIKDGDIYGSICYCKRRMFDFINGNLLRFHDIDNNGEMSLEEFKKIVDFWNMTESKRKAIRLKRRSDFLSDGHTIQEWKEKGNVNN